MPVGDRFRRWLEGAIGTGSGWDGLSGRPPSGNGASSFHLFWDVPPGEWIGAEATLEVIEPPTVPELHFWALQVGFASSTGRSGGAGHLGLQWFDPHPFATAVNWGGYGADGRELDGSVSELPSRSGNPNTRDFRWLPRRPYRLRVLPSADARGAWVGEVDDLDSGETTKVRELWAPGDRIGGPMVWSEVFAACDDPRSAVRWSDLAVIDVHGARQPVRSVRINYQALSDGGCAVTDSWQEGDGFVQATATPRRTPSGASLRCGGSGGDD